MTLFAGQNNAAGTLVDGGDLLVHYNDLLQGSVGDCYFLAALPALAKTSPADLQNLITVNANGTATVNFFGQPGQAAIPVTVDMTLDLGRDQAILSGDYNNNSQYEIWPQILEKAYDEFLKQNTQDRIGDGGTVSEVWQQLTGIVSNTSVVNDLDTDTIKTMIQTALNDRKLVSLATHWNADGKKAEMVHGPNQIPYEHCFAVVGINGDNVILYNPWGEQFEMPFSKLRNYFFRLRISQTPFPS